MSLIRAMRNLRYGEIFGVEIPLGGTLTPVELSNNEYDLVEAVKDGMQHIDVLTVHNGEPVLAETDYKDGDFHCRKRMRFPTTQKEG